MAESLLEMLSKSNLKNFVPSQNKTKQRVPFSFSLTFYIQSLRFQNAAGSLSPAQLHFVSEQAVTARPTPIPFLPSPVCVPFSAVPKKADRYPLPILVADRNSNPYVVCLV